MPTTFIHVPPINFLKDPVSYEIPSLSLSFQIDQGADGWASYPNSPPVNNVLTSVVSKIINLDETHVTNLKIQSKNIFDRILRDFSKIVHFTYNITIPLQIKNNNPTQVYNNITNLLKNSIIDNKFNDQLHTLGLDMNVTSIKFSKYVIVYQQTKTLDSNKATNELTEVTKFYIGVFCLMAVGVLLICSYVIYNKNKIMKDVIFKNKTENTPIHKNKNNNDNQHLSQLSKKNFIDVIPNPLLRRLSLD